jgi:hypothetical protein
LDFKALILSSPIMEHLTPERIEEIFNPGRFFKWAAAIVARTLGEAPGAGEIPREGQ